MPAPTSVGAGFVFALSVVMACRIGYRVFQGVEDGMGASQATPFGTSALTLFVFGMLAGYYACYAIGLLRWRHAVGA